jgi:glutamate transport system permease protein
VHVFQDPANQRAFVSAFAVILELTGMSALVSLGYGTLLAAMRVSPVPVLRWFAAVWVNVFRNTPLTLVIAFAYFGLFVNLGVALDSESIEGNNFWLGVVGLSAYTSAFVCEAVRAGINTVPAEQVEAARSIGLTFPQTLRFVVLPQALRAVVAPLGSVLIALAKNATIVGTIGVVETANVMKDLINDNGDAVIEIFLAFAAGFVVLLVPTGYLFGWLARRWAVRR